MFGKQSTNQQTSKRTENKKPPLILSAFSYLKTQIIEQIPYTMTKMLIKFSINLFFILNDLF
jgi:hypothetical protein